MLGQASLKLTQDINKLKRGIIMKKILIAIIMIITVLSLVACGGDTTEPNEVSADVSSVNMQEVYDSYASYLPEMVILEEKSMLNKYGVDATKCVQSIVANCNDGLKSDEIWLIEAVDADAAAEIADLAKSRVEREAEETKNYAPDQYAIVEKAEIIQDGNNVVLIISPDVDTLVELYNSAKA